MRGGASEGGHTEIVGTPFLREASTDLDADSGSSFALSFSLLSSAAGESRSVVDREDCQRARERSRLLWSNKSSAKSSTDSGIDLNTN